MDQSVGNAADGLGPFEEVTEGLAQHRPGGGLALGADIGAQSAGVVHLEVIQMERIARVQMVDLDKTVIHTFDFFTGQFKGRIVGLHVGGLADLAGLVHGLCHGVGFF